MQLIAPKLVLQKNILGIQTFSMLQRRMSFVVIVRIKPMPPCSEILYISIHIVHGFMVTAMWLCQISIRLNVEKLWANENCSHNKVVLWNYC